MKTKLLIFSASLLLLICITYLSCAPLSVSGDLESFKKSFDEKFTEFGRIIKLNKNNFQSIKSAFPEVYPDEKKEVEFIPENHIVDQWKIYLFKMDSDLQIIMKPYSFCTFIEVDEEFYCVLETQTNYFRFLYSKAEKTFKCIDNPKIRFKVFIVKDDYGDQNMALYFLDDIDLKVFLKVDSHLPKRINKAKSLITHSITR